MKKYTIFLWSFCYSSVIKFVSVGRVAALPCSINYIKD
ncbi:hypothetical protein B488_07210 [Liberibacter crescens BT-1]|uniref:Uncharacterized protein n=1 Tax=Liberibacter crescens (strain BT-1) TaxID=1215343 RepID=L0EVL8_LIBCB|nr:hypothetical protein B488_07210 [Liberibacter crescens BT-1]